MRSSDKSFEDIVEKWGRTYPNDAFTLSEAEAFAKDVQNLRDGGVDAVRSVAQVLGQEPKLKVVKKAKKTAKKARK